MHSYLSFRPLAAALALAAAAIPAAAPLQAQRPRTAPITVQWLGHAAFEVTSSGGTRILIDPFLSGNPATPDSLKSLARYKPAAILVSHAHDDHSLDAKKIAASSGAMVISAYEWIAAQGIPQSWILLG